MGGGGLERAVEEDAPMAAPPVARTTTGAAAGARRYTSSAAGMRGSRGASTTGAVTHHHARRAPGSEGVCDLCSTRHLAVGAPPHLPGYCSPSLHSQTSGELAGDGRGAVLRPAGEPRAVMLPWPARWRCDAG
jgi:hypothetical protein